MLSASFFACKNQSTRAAHTYLCIIFTAIDGACSCQAGQHVLRHAPMSAPTINQLSKTGDACTLLTVPCAGTGSNKEQRCAYLMICQPCQSHPSSTGRKAWSDRRDPSVSHPLYSHPICHWVDGLYARAALQCRCICAGFSLSQLITGGRIGLPPKGNYRGTSHYLVGIS